MYKKKIIIIIINNQFRWILKIPWAEKVTNFEVLIRMQKDTELLLKLKERKNKFLGHIMRGNRYEILRLIIEEKIEGRRTVSRRQN